MWDEAVKAKYSHIVRRKYSYDVRIIIRKRSGIVIYPVCSCVGSVSVCVGVCSCVRMRVFVCVVSVCVGVCVCVCMRTCMYLRLCLRTCPSMRLSTKYAGYKKNRSAWIINRDRVIARGRVHFLRKIGYFWTKKPHFKDGWFMLSNVHMSVKTYKCPFFNGEFCKRGLKRDPPPDPPNLNHDSR